MSELLLDLSCGFIVSTAAFGPLSSIASVKTESRIAAARDANDGCRYTMTDSREGLARRICEEIAIVPRPGTQ